MLRPPSALRTLAAVLIVAGATSVSSLAAPPPALAAPGAGATTAARGAGPETTPPPTPLVGDFDGDGRSDHLWYGSGSSPDHAWYGRSDRGFTGRAVSVGGTYTPLVGDFGGDGRDDVLWYGPGAAPDYLWQGSRARGFVGRSVTVGGTYQPSVGDFDGDRHDDVLWYSASGPDRLWYGTDAGFRAVPMSITRPYTPVIGDFDGSGTTDVLWYGPGADRDYLWRGRSSRGFTGASVVVGGSYTPVVGDFGGDGPEDIYWQGPATSGVLWKGTRRGGFSGGPAEAVGPTAPVVGDFDGDGAADLVWDNPGSGSDRVWYGTGDGFALRVIQVGSTYTAEPGDYDGDGRDDLFWFAAGAPRDVLWFAGPNRGFSSRPSTLDPLPGADAPFRQDTWASQFEPYGYVAHAFGPTPPALDALGRSFGYTNSLEAFEYNYEKGFRVFEVDWVRLADGTVLAAHNGSERSYGLPAGVKFADAQRSQLSGHFTVGGGNGNPSSSFTVLYAADLVELLDTHPDAYVVLDTKFDHLEIVAEFVRLTTGRPDLMDRLVPHVAGQEDLDQLRALYPIRNYVLALYRSQAFNRFDDPAVARFVRDNRVPAVMMWWGRRDPMLSLAANMLQQRRFTPTFVAQLRAAGAVTYVHSLSTAQAIQRYTSDGIGVYSNGPFPPFPPEQAPLEPQIEGGPLA